MSNYLKGLGLGLLLGYAGVVTLGCLIFGYGYIKIREEMDTDLNKYRWRANPSAFGMNDIKRAPYSYNKYYRTYAEEKNND